MSKLMLIEDDPAIVMGLEESLKQAGFELTVYTDGADGYDAIIDRPPDLLLLDIMLPGRNGLEIMRTLRENGYTFPIIMLTSKKEEIDKVVGFEFGADDYVTKPFGIMELIARIKALLRRSERTKKNPDEFQFNNIKVVFSNMEVIKNGESIMLSAKEMALLKYFIQHEGNILSRDVLLDNVWGYDSFPTTRTVDNYILALRKKLEDEPSKPRHFLTIPTVGYKFVSK
jgi:DNA-binding response OmpR family regulator